MKLFFARGLALTVLAAAGCAVGSAAEAGDGIALGVPVDADPDADAGADAGARSPTAPPAGADGGTSSAVDAGVADAPAAADAGPISACAFTGPLLAFDLGQAMGAQVDLLPAAKAAGLSATALRRSGVVTVASNHAMNASDWPSGSLDVARHFAFTVTPPAGCAFTAATLSVDLKASATGPTSAAVGTSADGFGALQSVPVSTAGGPVVVPVLGGGGKAGGVVEVRIFGFAASSSAGTLRLQGTLALTGSIGAL
jgi:hypothetical protein